MADAAEANILQTLAVEHACTRLALDYSHYADSAQFDAWAALFTEDAEMVLMGQRHKGRAAIRASVGKGDPNAVASFHSLSNIRIDVVNAELARGTVGVTLFMAPKVNGVGSAKVMAPAAIGNYHDTYKKTAEGWRIARREFAATIMRAQA